MTWTSHWYVCHMSLFSLLPIGCLARLVLAVDENKLWFPGSANHLSVIFFLLLLSLQQATAVFNPQRPAASCRVLLPTASVEVQNDAADHLSAKCWQLTSRILGLPWTQIDARLRRVHILSYTYMTKEVCVYLFSYFYRISVYFSHCVLQIWLWSWLLQIKKNKGKKNVNTWRHI